jgi:hypothetical protein
MTRGEGLEMRSWGIACWLVVAVGLAVPGGVFAQGLQNASFEDPETSGFNPFSDLAAGWGRWGHWMNRETEWKPTFDGICMMGYHHWRIERAEASGFFQDVWDVPSHRTCIFEIQVYPDPDTNAESVEVRLERSGGFHTLATQLFYFRDLKRGSWNKLSVTGMTMEENGVRAVVIVTPKKEGGRNGAVKFDAAALRIEGDAAIGGELGEVPAAPEPVVQPVVQPAVQPVPVVQPGIRSVAE